MSLISYLTVLHPYSALPAFTDGWQFLPFISVSTLRTPHATFILMSDRVSLVKPSPLQFRALHQQVLLSATPQGGMFPEVPHPQALLGSLVSIF